MLRRALLADKSHEPVAARALVSEARLSGRMTNDHPGAPRVDPALAHRRRPDPGAGRD
ncbi:MAG: hypothetical protein JWR28_535, partial [Modestobacter sp.]|nr:hypothetical protein [Modestobacter sp.]